MFHQTTYINVYFLSKKLKAFVSDSHSFTGVAGRTLQYDDHGDRLD